MKTTNSLKRIIDYQTDVLFESIEKPWLIEFVSNSEKVIQPSDILKQIEKLSDREKSDENEKVCMMHAQDSIVPDVSFCPPGSRIFRKRQRITDEKINFGQKSCFPI